MTLGDVASCRRDSTRVVAVCSCIFMLIVGAALWLKPPRSLSFCLSLAIAAITNYCFAQLLTRLFVVMCLLIAVSATQICKNFEKLRNGFL